jgi:hypothetical protein
MGTIVMDWNGIFELAGSKYKTKCRKFYSTIITSFNKRQDPSSLKYYYHQVVIPKQPKLLVFRTICQLVSDWGEYRPNLCLIGGQQVIEVMHANGAYPIPVGDGQPPNKQTDLKVHCRDCFNFFRLSGDRFIIAGPSCLPLGLQEPITLVTDPLGNVAMAADFRRGCTGVFRHNLDGPDCILSKIQKRLQEVVGPDGSRQEGMVLCDDSNAAGLAELLATLGVQDDLNQAAIFNASVKAAVCQLMVMQHDNTPHVQLQFGACITPFPHPPYDAQWLIEGPSFSVRNLAEPLTQNGISVFRGIVPLKEEGVLLRIFPGVNESVSDSKIDLGKLVFVPPGNVFLSPAHLIYSDGIRTSLSGNPRLIFWVFVWDREVDPALLPIIPRFPTRLDPTVSLNLPEGMSPNPLDARFGGQQMDLLYNLIGF